MIIRNSQKTIIFNTDICNQDQLMRIANCCLCILRIPYHVYYDPINFTYHLSNNEEKGGC